MVLRKTDRRPQRCQWRRYGLNVSRLGRFRTNLAFKEGTHHATFLIAGQMSFHLELSSAECDIPALDD
jgi:hypothetical protein